MCGRYQLALPGPSVAALLDVEYAAGSVQPTWNAAPGQAHPVLVPGGRDGIVLESAAWGFVSRASRAAGVRPLVNARVEGVARRRSFRDAAHHGRILVPATGFYEWSGARGAKVPWAIRVRGRAVDPMAGTRLDHDAVQGEVVEPFLLAGIRDEETGTYAVLTTEPNEVCAPIHDRMPVILDRDDADAWLDADEPDVEALIAQLAVPFDAARMEAWPVSTLVNRAAADGPELVAPRTEPEEPQQSLL